MMCKTCKTKKDNLLKAVKMVARFIKPSTLSILQCVRIEAINDTLILTATSNQAVAKTKIDANTKEASSCAVNSKKLIEVLSRMSSEYIELLFNEDDIIIKGGKAKVKIPCLDMEAWTKLPIVTDPDFEMSFSADYVKQMIDEAAHSLDTSETNVMMSSFCFEVSDNENIKVVALDGHRVSFRGETKGASKRFVLNGQITKESFQILAGETTMRSEGSLVSFEDNDTRIDLKTTPGNYYEYNQLVRATTKANDAFRLDADKRELIEALNLASIVNSKVSLLVAPDSIEVSSMSHFGEDTVTEVAVVSSREFEPFRIGFTASFLLDTLKSVADDVVVLQLSSPSSPLVIEGDNFMELVLPCFVKN